MISNLLKGIRAWQRQGLFSKGPLWKNARMVFADVPVEYEVAREWVPFPLLLPRPATATVFIARYDECVFGVAYHEVGLMLRVKLFGVFPMLYCPWMLVDDDMHLINGREMLGYPKKMAKIHFEEKDGRVIGTAERRGNEVFRLEGTIGEHLQNPAPGAGQWWANLRHMITFFPGHIVIFRPTETIHEAHAMDLTVTINPSDADPLCRVIGPARNMSIRTCDMGADFRKPTLRIWPVGPFFQAKLMSLRTR